MSERSLILGKRILTGYPDFFNGSLDDVRIYKNRTLSENEMLALYNKGRGTELDFGYVDDSADVDVVHEVCISHLPFDKRARVLFIELTSTGNLEVLGLVFREFYFDGDR
jgi:hypothetical protein